LEPGEASLADLLPPGMPSPESATTYKVYSGAAREIDVSPDDKQVRDVVAQLIGGDFSKWSHWLTPEPITQPPCGGSIRGRSRWAALPRVLMCLTEPGSCLAIELREA
jgi:hypothetical protein